MRSEFFSYPLLSKAELNTVSTKLTYFVARACNPDPHLLIVEDDVWIVPTRRHLLQTNLPRSGCYRVFCFTLTTARSKNATTSQACCDTRVGSRGSALRDGNDYCGRY